MRLLLQMVYVNLALITKLQSSIRRQSSRWIIKLNAKLQPVVLNLLLHPGENAAVAMPIWFLLKINVLAFIRIASSMKGFYSMDHAMLVDQRPFDHQIWKNALHQCAELEPSSKMTEVAYAKIPTFCKLVIIDASICLQRKHTISIETFTKYKN